MPKAYQEKKKSTIRPENTRAGSSPSGTETPVESHKTSPLLQGVISVFIAFHLIAITCWALPYNPSLLIGAREIVRPYMLWTGLFQTWDMFAPNPIQVNTYIKAVVMTKNHHMYVWAYPRMEQLSYMERYRKERYRKFAENLLMEKYELLLPDAVNHIARLYADPSDPPVKVILLKYQSNISPAIDSLYQPEPKPEVFYEDYVEPEDLR